MVKAVAFRVLTWHLVNPNSYSPNICIHAGPRPQALEGPLQIDVLKLLRPCQLSLVALQALTPHHFNGLQGLCSEPVPWSVFLSECILTGSEIQDSVSEAGTIKHLLWLPMTGSYHFCVVLCPSGV